MQILGELAQAAEEMCQVQADFDFERVKELVEQNSELRPKLAAVTDHLRGYQPESDQERELLAYAPALLEKIKEGDRLFTIWRGNLEMMRRLGTKMASQAVQNLAFLSEEPPWDVLAGRFDGGPSSRCGRRTLAR